jgi:5-methylcytosine-specific restriction endonuclease McrA
MARLREELDGLVAKAVKHRDGYVCQKCGRAVQGRNAHWAHVVPKGSSLLLRWYMDNALCLCFQCHRFWAHLDPIAFDDWFRAKFPLRAVELDRLRVLDKAEAREREPSLARAFTEAGRRELVEEYKRHLVDRGVEV